MGGTTDETQDPSVLFTDFSKLPAFPSGFLALYGGEQKMESKWVPAKDGVEDIRGMFPSNCDWSWIPTLLNYIDKLEEGSVALLDELEGLGLDYANTVKPLADALRETIKEKK